MATFNGTSGNDVFVGTAADDLILGNDGDDALVGGSGFDEINGGNGNDGIEYRADMKIADGGAGVDTMNIGDSRITTVDLNNTTNHVTATGGTFGIAKNFENVDGQWMTTNVILKGTSSGNLLRGGSGNDVILGGGGADYLYGGAGDDGIEYRSDAVVIDGGAGTDNITLGDPSVTLVDLSNTADQVAGGGTTTGIENVDAQWMTTNVTLKGTSSSNFLRAGSGNDVILGGGGADYLYGGAGDDGIEYRSDAVVIDGGTGNDSLTMGGSSSFTVDLSNTADQVAGGGTTTGFENINASWVTMGYVNITGDSNNNVLIGGAGNDTILGGAGNDIIYGGAGDDTLKGDAGDDQLFAEGGNLFPGANTILEGGAGVDTYTCGSGFDTIRINPGDIGSTVTEHVYSFKEVAYGSSGFTDALTTNGDTINERLYHYSNSPDRNYRITGDTPESQLITLGSGGKLMLHYTYV